MKKEMTATLLFLIKQNEVLLAMKKRGFGVDRYNGVGGKPESNETIEQTMIRETNEEINVTPVKFEQVANITFDEYFKGEPIIMHIHVFTCTLWTGTPTESEEMAPEWFTSTDLPFDKMWSDDPYWLPQVLSGSKVTAEFKLNENDEIINHNVTKVDSF
jgi:ADP-ribose pyrophosphatase YjhB (NUDIX family)